MFWWYSLWRVVFIGSPSLEEKYNKLTFTRTELIPQLTGDPITSKVTYTGDQMLEKRLVQITPEELFKTRYNQSVNLIMLDVRPESDYNLYHINGALNVPLDKLESVTPDLLSEPPANSVFVVMGNDEQAATDGMEATRRLSRSECLYPRRWDQQLD